MPELDIFGLPKEQKLDMFGLPKETKAELDMFGLPKESVEELDAQQIDKRLKQANLYLPAEGAIHPLEKPLLKGIKTKYAYSYFDDYGQTPEKKEQPPKPYEQQLKEVVGPVRPFAKDPLDYLVRLNKGAMQTWDIYKTQKVRENPGVFSALEAIPAKLLNALAPASGKEFQENVAVFGAAGMLRQPIKAAEPAITEIYRRIQSLFAKKTPNLEKEVPKVIDAVIKETRGKMAETFIERSAIVDRRSPLARVPNHIRKSIESGEFTLEQYKANPEHYENLFNINKPAIQITKEGKVIETPRTRPMEETIELKKEPEKTLTSKLQPKHRKASRQSEQFYDPIDRMENHILNEIKKGSYTLEEYMADPKIYNDKQIAKISSMQQKVLESRMKYRFSDAGIDDEVNRLIQLENEKYGGLEMLAEEEKILSQSGAITFGKKAKPSYSFENPETEKLFQLAKGISKEGIIQRIKNLAIEIGHKFSRDYEHLPRTPQNAQLIFDLKYLEKQKDVVAHRTTWNVGEMLSRLDKSDYDIFSRKVILDDLVSDVTRGLYRNKELPFKLTQQSLIEEADKVHSIVLSNPRLQEALTKRQEIWNEVKIGYINALKPYKIGVEDMFKDNYYRHQVLDYVNNNGIFGTGKRMRPPTNKGYMQERAGYSGLYNTDFLEAEHQIMAQMMHDAETAKTLTKIKVKEDISKSLKTKAKDLDKNWKELVPEGYTVWQPKEGNVFYPAMTIPENTAEKIMSGELEDIAEIASKLKEVLAVGGKKQEWVIRQEVADTLNNLVRERPGGILSTIDKNIMVAWKKWQLISPRRYIKYNIRNLSGDSESGFLGNVSGFKESPRATKELAGVFYKKQPMTEDMQAWFDRGGMSSTLQAQEMDSLKQMWMFSRLYEQKRSVPELWNKYWKHARLSTDMRESILRYSNFLDYKKQLIEGGGKPKNYGASDSKMIDALKDINDKAFWLSNDLMGAYDRVSIAGQTIRERIFPFWSWQEVNAKRYIQLYKNATNDGNLTVTIGKQLGAKTPLAALRVGRLAVKTAAFFSMLQVYNHSMYPEEEKQLPKDIKMTPHVILGKDDKGNIQYFNRLGTLNDFISWFGLDYAPRFVGDYLSGKTTMKELLQDQAKQTVKAPINKITQGSFPLTKLAYETSTKRSLFPDVFKPGTIRNTYLNLARSFGLENEYIAMSGLPSKGYEESLKNLVIYSIDPGEAAYRNIYDLRNRFMKKQGKTTEGFWLTPTGDAFYNMKLAVKYKDKEAFSRYFNEYTTLAKEQLKVGAMAGSIPELIKSMSPLSGMSQIELGLFMKSLTPDDKDTLKQAMDFYKETLSGLKNMNFKKQ